MSLTNRTLRRVDRFWQWLIGIMAVGFAIRVTFVLVLQSRITKLTGDAGWYHFQAKLVSEGRGFLNPIHFYDTGALVPGADHPPGFVLLLAGLDMVGISSTQAQRIAMCVLGTVSIMVIGLLGRRLVGPRTGLIAAVIAAVYPNIWVNDGMLMTETVFILATAVSLLFVYRYFESPTRGNLAVISASLTVGGLVRPEAVLLFVMLATPLVLSRRTLALRERLIQLGIAALIPIVAFAPWFAYNLGRFEEPVLISSGLGQTLLAGNCDKTYSGDLLGYWDFSCLGKFVHVRTSTGDLSAMDSQYRSDALDYMRVHKGELPKVMAARVGRLWGVFRGDQSVLLDGQIEGRAGGPVGTDLQIARESLWSYYVLAPLSLVGLWILRRRKVQILPLLAQAALITFVAAMTFGLTRYRAGVEVSITVLAAVALSQMYTFIGGPKEETVKGPIGAQAVGLDAPLRDATRRGGGSMAATASDADAPTDPAISESTTSQGQT